MNGWRISKSGQQPFENSLQQRAESALTGAAAHHTSISIHPSIPAAAAAARAESFNALCFARRLCLSTSQMMLVAILLLAAQRSHYGQWCAEQREKRLAARWSSAALWSTAAAADLGAPSHWILAHCDAARRLCCMRAEWAPNRGGGVSERIALRTMCLRIGLQRQQNLPPHCVMRKIFGVGARQQIAPRGSRFWYVRVYLCVRDDFFPHNRFEPSSPGHSFRSVDFCVSQHEILCVLSLWTAKALAFNYASLDCAYFIEN